jgi:type IV secretory pathway VirB10-like protein
MTDEGFTVKGAAPLERAAPPAGGFFDKRKIALLVAGVVTVGGLAAWGMTIRGEDTEEVKLSEVTAANINVGDARPRDVATPPAEDEGTAPPAGEPTGQENRQAAAPKPKGPPQGWQKVSPVVMRGNRSGQVQQAAQGQQDGRQQLAQGGGRDYPVQGYADQEDYGDGYGGEDRRGTGRRSNKQSFYQGGVASGGSTDLDIPGDLMPELPGCVLKAGTYIPLQNRSRVRTALPARVLGYVYQAVEGNHYLGNGQVERCTAIRPMSTVLSEVNASGVERGDLRIQACALRLDLNGGGRRPLGCQPAHGADGGAGIEATSDYEVTGIATGILIEAALATARSLTGLIAGPAGIAVQVGASGISDVGSEYVRNELKKPPVLTMDAGAIWGIQINADLSFPLID